MSARHTRRPGRLPLRLHTLEGRIAPATFTVTNDNNSGAGSLRQAVLDANAAAGADLINFSTYFNVPRTITLASGISITGAVTIDGTSAANATVTGSYPVRIFDIQSAPAGTSISLEDLTLTSGYAANGSGGAIRAGDVALSLLRCVFTGNGAFYDGGAISMGGGSLTATDCDFTDNSCLLGIGGAIYLSGTSALTATDCNFTGNFAIGGGAILVLSDSASTVLTRCTISDNSAYEAGGLGVHGSLLLEDSSVSGNKAFGKSGDYGYYPSSSGGISVSGGATIRNSTISGNGAGIAGGIRCISGALVVQNSTITGNQAWYGEGGGIWSNQITLESSIVAGNNSVWGGPDINAASVTVKNSSILSRTGITTFNDQGGNRPAGEDPRLGSLQNNGGPTKTHALLPGSPCVDVGSNPANLTTDQRGLGFARVLNGTTDMGAYEGVDPIPTATPISVPATITSAGGTSYTVVVRYDDDVGIDLATIDLNDIAVTGPGYAAPQTPIARSISGSGQVVTVTYTFPAPGSTFDYLDDGQYSVGIVGNQVGDADIPVQHFVAAGPLGAFRVNIPIQGPLVVDELSDIDDGDLSPGHLSLREAVRLTNAASPTSDTITFSSTVFGTPHTISLTAGEFAIKDQLTIVGPGAELLTLNGGGASRLFNIDLPSTTYLVSLSGLTLINGLTTGAGGAIYADARLKLSGVVINQTSSSIGGGGIYAFAGLALSEVMISNCTTSQYGGGVFANGIVVIEHSSFVNNFAGVSGGGICTTSGTMQIADSSIVGNSANSPFNYYVGGGGIYLSEVNPVDSFIRNCTISGNVAANNCSGGGILLINFVGALTIANSTITGNTTPNRGGGIACQYYYGAPSISLNSTIVAGNSASTGPDLNFDTLTSIACSNSLIGVANTSNLTLTGAGNLTGTLAAPLNPMLGPIAFNGGLTKTHALLPGSLAIDAGNNTAGLAFDQRGPNFVRVFNGKADIGAFELQPATVPPCVSGKAVIINDGAAQRSRVTSVTIDFDQVVTLPINPADAFQLKRQSDNALVALTASVTTDSVTHVMLTFNGAFSQFGSLEDGRYTITAFASKVSNANGNLDGDCNGAGGDDFVLTSAGTNGVFRLFGDADGNGSVTAADFNAFRLAYGTAGPSIFDFNGDGQVNANDFNQFRTRYGLTLIP